MKKVYLIGDCHSTRISELYKHDIPDVKLKIWGKGGQHVYYFDTQLQEFRKNNIRSSSFEHSVDRKIGSIGFRDIKDDGIVLSWFGYVDIKSLLPKHNDAAETVKKYIDGIKNYFPKSTIKIIEPIPQFVESILMPEEDIPDFSYELRKQQNDLFLQELRNYAKLCNIEILISQEEILNCINLKELHLDQATKIGNFYLDRLQIPYMQKIYELIISKIIAVN
jgi:hypothetical protein